MAGDDVGHVAGEQAIAVLLGIEQPEAGARERLGAEREPGRIERRRNDAERRQRALLVLDRRCRRQHIERPIINRKPAPPSAKVDASATTRREADSAASSGTTTSQIAANEPMPPVSDRDA